MIPPSIVIIVPVFKHPGLLPEALDAALAQRDAALAIVIVDDGCPYEETRIIGTAYAMAEPRVTYLRKRNGGLSSARNFGIDYALRAWPGLEAVYFLDADNRLTPTAMANALGLMRQSGADWVYPSIDKFGIEWSGNYQAPYSRLAHVTFDNICEAGSLVHRRVLDAGIRFDETMKAGYEDWEFWLQALSRGFRGRCHPSFGLEYRQRAESMLRDSNRQRAGILAYMRDKHRDLFSLRNLLAWEHEEAPRFALFTDSGGDVLWFSDVGAAPRRVTLDQHAESFAAEELEPETQGTPPYAIWLPAPAVAALRRAGLLANLLWHAQRLCAAHHAVAIHLEADPRGIALELDGEAPAAAPIGFAAGQQALREAIGRDGGGWLAAVAQDADSPEIGRLVLRLPCAEDALLPGAAAPTPVATAARLRQDHDPARRRRWIWRKPGALPAIRNHADHLAGAVGAGHVMPRRRDGRRHVGFAVPGGIADGAGLVAALLAATLRRAGFVTHLFVLGAEALALGETPPDAFDSVSFLGAALPAGGPHDFLGQRIALAGDLEGAGPLLLGLLTELDVLVCGHVPALAAVLGDLRKQGTKVVGHLQALERSALGRGSGHPYLALAFEHVHDLLLASSPALLDWLRGHGVPEPKLCLLPPAPSLAIGDEERDRIVTERLGRRPGLLRVALLAGPGAGREAREARLRLVTATRQAGLPVDWIAVGEGWDGAARRRMAPLGVGMAETLADAVAAADLLLLPEVAEAAPVAVRDAQLLGCVPVVLAGSPEAALVADGAGLVLEEAAMALPLLRDLAADPARLAQLSAVSAAQGAAAPGWEAASRALRAWMGPA
jgi:GT2 family glycosyltransferase